MLMVVGDGIGGGGTHTYCCFILVSSWFLVYGFPFSFFTGMDWDSQIVTISVMERLGYTHSICNCHIAALFVMYESAKSSFFR